MTYNELLFDFVESVMPSMLNLSKSEYERQKEEVMHEAEETGRKNLIGFMKTAFLFIDDRREQGEKAVQNEG